MDEMHVSAAELAGVLGVTPRRVRQLTEEGLIKPAHHGKYDLAACARAYIARIEADRAGEVAELRGEKLALVRAQRRRVELDNAQRQGTDQDLTWQDRMIEAVGLVWMLEMRRVADWTYVELAKRNIAEAVPIAGTVQAWITSLRIEIAGKLRAAAAEARRREMKITRADDLLQLIGTSKSEVEQPWPKIEDIFGENRIKDPPWLSGRKVK
jgi:hypothetical protein